MLDVISHADQYASFSRAVMPLLKFWQIYQRLQDSLATRTLDEFASDVIELTGYKAMLEADAAKGHEDAADRLQNLGQLVNNVKKLLRPARRGSHTGRLSGGYRPHQ